MSHFIDKCECGVVLAQCRCMDANKSVRIVRPCTHGKPVAEKKPEPSAEPAQ